LLLLGKGIQLAPHFTPITTAFLSCRFNDAVPAWWRMQRQT
jgi:hypothetical protein